MKTKEESRSSVLKNKNIKVLIQDYKASTGQGRRRCPARGSQEKLPSKLSPVCNYILTTPNHCMVSEVPREAGLRVLLRSYPHTGETKWKGEEEVRGDTGHRMNTAVLKPEGSPEGHGDHSGICDTRSNMKGGYKPEIE